MRIVSGIHRGRKLETPKGDGVRPTSDKVRQAIFNMLNSRGILQQANVIDAFCGTGALGLEALSLGAAYCTFFDKDKNSMQLCRQNISALKEEDRSKVILADSTKMKDNEDETIKAHLVFMDPPYGKNLISQSIKALYGRNWLHKECIFVLEENKNESIDCDLIEMIANKIYGDTQIFLATLKT